MPAKLRFKSFQYCRFVHYGGVICLVASIVTSGTAQQLPTKVQKADDQRLHIPVSSHKPLGHSDPSALSELTAYKALIGGEAWEGMAAKGNISFDGATDTLPAELSVLPGNRVKLDITKPEGHDITVYSGARGSISYAGSKKVFLAPKAVASGFMPFDLPLAVASGASMKHTVIDHGSALLDGASYHHISIEVAIPKRDLFPYEKEDRSVVDLYFDPTTHLLAKTVSYIPIPGSSVPTLLKENTYSNYQRSGRVLLPMTIEEAINGQLIWKLALSSVDSKKTLSSKDFNF